MGTLYNKKQIVTPSNMRKVERLLAQRDQTQLEPLCVPTGHKATVDDMRANILMYPRGRNTFTEEHTAVCFAFL